MSRFRTKNILLTVFALLLLFLRYWTRAKAFRHNIAIYVKFILTKIIINNNCRCKNRSALESLSTLLSKTADILFYLVYILFFIIILVRQPAFSVRTWVPGKLIENNNFYDFIIPKHRVSRLTAPMNAYHVFYITKRRVLFVSTRISSIHRRVFLAH